MRDEIVAGLKNAIDRGYSLDEAVRSFINAGYNPQEVKQAAEYLGTGASTIMEPRAPPMREKNAPETKEKKPGNQQMPMARQENQIGPKKIISHQPLQEKPKGKGKKILFIIFLIIILLALVGGIVLLIIFRERAIEIFRDWTTGLF